MFRRILGAGLLLALVGLLAPVPAVAQKKDAKDKDIPTIDADTLRPGEVNGKLQTTPGTDGSFTVRVEVKKQEIDPKALEKLSRAGGKENAELEAVVREQERIARLQAELARERTPSAQ